MIVLFFHLKSIKTGPDLLIHRSTSLICQKERPKCSVLDSISGGAAKNAMVYSIAAVICIVLLIAFCIVLKRTCITKKGKSPSTSLGLIFQYSNFNLLFQKSTKLKTRRSETPSPTQNSKLETRKNTLCNSKKTFLKRY